MAVPGFLSWFICFSCWVVSPTHLSSSVVVVGSSRVVVVCKVVSVVGVVVVLMAAGFTVPVVVGCGVVVCVGWV